MVELFESYPVTESLLLWYPLFIVAAELTLIFIRRNLDESIHQQVAYASTSMFVTLVNLEAWHFMILYDRAGLAVALFLLGLWRDDYSSRSSSSSNPCVLVVRYISCGLGANHALLLFAAQCVGVAAGFQAAKQMWSIGLCEFHRHRVFSETPASCATHLQVWWLYGFVFEFSASLVQHVAFSTELTEHRSLENCIKSLIHSVVGVITMDYTGFFLNPLAASMRTFGCGSTPIHEHLVVYWVGAIGGTVVGIAVQPTLARAATNDECNT